MGESKLAKRSWTSSRGVVLIVLVGTTAAAAISAGFTEGLAERILVPLIVVVGIGLAVLLNWKRGVGQNEARVTAARSAWAQARSGATFEPQAAPDAASVELALPRGWRVWSVRARVSFAVSGAPVTAETWMLRSAPGSTRSPAVREVVWTAASTGTARVSVPLGVSIDPLLALPKWADVDGSGGDESWLPEVRERVARHQDVLAMLTIGDGRVVFFALDDPRPEKMVERAQLVRDVAAMVRP